MTSPPSATPSGADSRVYFDASSCILLNSWKARSNGAAIALRLRREILRISSSFSSGYILSAPAIQPVIMANLARQVDSQGPPQLKSHILFPETQYSGHTLSAA